MVFVPFWSEKEYKISPLGPESGTVFEKNYWSIWTYLSFHWFQMIKKEREMCEFQKDFNKSSLLRL